MWGGGWGGGVLVAAGWYLLIHRVNAVVWTTFKTAGLSMVIAIGGIALWHVLRTPWLLHKEVLGAGGGTGDVHWGHGLFGMVALAGVLGGRGVYAGWQFGHRSAP